jgi:hypothetical protein
MQSLAPALAEQRIKVVVSTADRRSLKGEWVDTTATIYLYAGGHNEQVLLHELAHVAVPVIPGSKSKHIIHGAEYKATLLRYERIWRKHNKIRGRQVVTAAEDEETTQPMAPKHRRRQPTYAPVNYYSPPRETFLRRLGLLVLRLFGLTQKV